MEGFFVFFLVFIFREERKLWAVVSEIALEFSPVLWMDRSSAASEHGGHLMIRHSEYRASHVLVVSLPQGGRNQNGCFGQWFGLALIALCMQWAFNK